VVTTPSWCPPALPSGGGACSGTRDCSYGDDPRFNCRPTATCTDGGTWTVGDAGCGPAPTCPVAAPTTPVSCTIGEICGYPDDSCICSSPCKPPVCFAVAPIAAPTFQCAKPADGCPPSAPNLGTSCPKNDVACNYDACGGGVSIRCADGVWKRNPLLCPL
jgi:hypothetical protein